VVVDLSEERSLAEGTVVDAAIVARLARIPLLRLEGTVVLTPGRAVPTLSTLPAVPTRSEPERAGGEIGAALPDVARRLERLRTERSVS
jgi:hypothetical protein